MKYECEIKEGQHLEIDNEGAQTFVNFSNRATGQQQSQGQGFTTGAWLKTPAVFRVGADIVIRAQTGEGTRFLRVQERRVVLLDGELELKGAEEIELKESSETSGWKPMEPMRPMKPMRPMN